MHHLGAYPREQDAEVVRLGHRRLSSRPIYRDSRKGHGIEMNLSLIKPRSRSWSIEWEK